MVLATLQRSGQSSGELEPCRASVAHLVFDVNGEATDRSRVVLALFDVGRDCGAGEVERGGLVVDRHNKFFARWAARPGVTDVDVDVIPGWSGHRRSGSHVRAGGVLDAAPRPVEDAEGRMHGSLEPANEPRGYRHDDQEDEASDLFL